jgi:hypothetical protein
MARARLEWAVATVTTWGTGFGAVASAAPKEVAGRQATSKVQVEPSERRDKAEAKRRMGRSFAGRSKEMKEIGDYRVIGESANQMNTDCDNFVVSIVRFVRLTRDPGSGETIAIALGVPFCLSSFPTLSTHTYIE